MLFTRSQFLIQNQMLRMNLVILRSESIVVFQKLSQSCVRESRKSNCDLFAFSIAHSEIICKPTQLLLEVGHLHFSSDARAGPSHPLFIQTLPASVYLLSGPLQFFEFSVQTLDVLLQLPRNN